MVIQENEPNYIIKVLALHVSSKAAQVRTFHSYKNKHLQKEDCSYTQVIKKLDLLAETY